MFDALFAEGPLVTVHAIAAMAALGLGILQFAGPKGVISHRAIGYCWVTAMAIVAVSSFWIHDFRIIGPFSPVHILSVVVLFTVPMAVLHARRGQIGRHRKAMISIFVVALIGAGLFTLLPLFILPGIRMHYAAKEQQRLEGELAR